MPNLDAIQAFHWERQPKAEALVRELLEDFLARNSFAASLARRMKEETGTRFYDWVDSIRVCHSPGIEEKLRTSGFEPEPRKNSKKSADENLQKLADLASSVTYRNPSGIFPFVIVCPNISQAATTVFIKVDSVSDFLVANQLTEQIEFDPFSPIRFSEVAHVDYAPLYAIERRGQPDFNYVKTDPAKRIAAARHLEFFRMRPRHFDHEADGFRVANDFVDIAIADLDVDQTCALFFQAEREFWQRRNRAAQVQKARQDRLGLGWGNHDHHTYRSSRACFKDLIALHEKLGLVCRERFYAGREAGWGAQVMENSRAGIVTFNDVDLSPEELVEDFAHRPLAPRDSLGTVGLWCALHGEAFLQAGMHHLECQFDFDALKQQLERDHGVGVMKPFTDYPYLRQAFTEGERWAVAPERIDKLLAAKLITPQQAEQFRAQGAIGSHLENLERNEGFKGFNQKGVSEIIAATDPRRHVAQVS